MNNMATGYEILCKDCKQITNKPYSDKEKEPCIFCGSNNTGPVVVCRVEVGIGVSARVEASVLSPDTPSILLQSFVVPVRNISEGAIIKAALVPWLEIIKLITRDPNAIFQIEARRWEEIIAAAYEQAGFDEVILTPRSGDGGKDVIAIKKGLEKFVSLIK